jgi:hypothetical protein
VDVVEDEEKAAVARPQLEERYDRLEEAQLGLARVARGGRRRAICKLRKQLGQLAGRRTQIGAHEGRVLRGEVLPYRLDERQVGKRELCLRAAPPQDVAAQLARSPSQLRGEPSLADPCLAGEQNETSLAPIHRQERVLELRQLLLPSDEHGGENPLEHATILPGRVSNGERAEARPRHLAGRTHDEAPLAGALLPRALFRRRSGYLCCAMRN